MAHARPFHPIRLWLQGLEHDGTSRIDKWLIHVLGESPDTLSAPVAEYLKLVGRFWLLGMVNRVMEPGCKFDYCPVLEGPGGYRKSTLVEALAGTPYFSDTHFDVGRGKEGQEQVQGLWMYEIAELANFGKAEIGLIKAFITAKVDRYRPSYGRVVESFARQCVLAGTTNESTYLRDRTGNRRFWPIDLGSGTNFNTTAGAWQAGNFLRTSGSVTFVNQTAGSTLNITGVDCRLGSVAPTVFERRMNELQLCQRYLPVLSGNSNSLFGFFYSTTNAFVGCTFPVTARVAPTGVTFSNAGDFTIGDAVSVANVATSASFSAAGTLTAQLIFVTAAVLTPQRAGLVYANNAAAKIIFTGARLF